MTGRPRRSGWETTHEHNYQRLAETDWKGQAREAALERAGLDLVKVRGPAWQLREAATAARYGFTQQNGAKEWALDAVADAEQAGFNPKEDLSLTDRLTGGSAATRVARQAEAQTPAAQIRHRAALLVASNQEIATRITAAAGNIGEFSFDEPTSVAPTRSGQKTNGIQLVDNKTWKQDPPPPPPSRGPTRVCLPRAFVLPSRESWRRGHPVKQGNSVSAASISGTKMVVNGGITLMTRGIIRIGTTIHTINQIVDEIEFL